MAPDAVASPPTSGAGLETTVNATPPVFFAYPEELDPDARWVIVHARCGHRAGDYASLAAAQDAIARGPLCGWCQQDARSLVPADDFGTRGRGDF